MSARGVSTSSRQDSGRVCGGDKEQLREAEAAAGGVYSSPPNSANREQSVCFSSQKQASPIWTVALSLLIKIRVYLCMMGQPCSTGLSAQHFEKPQMASCCVKDNTDK